MLNFFFGFVSGVAACIAVSFGFWWWMNSPNYDLTGRKLGFFEKLIG